MKNRNKMNISTGLAERILIWLGFGVILSIVPLVLACVIQAAFYNPATESDYIPDLILVSFAISGNALGCAYGKKSSARFVEKLFGFICIILMIVCIAFYFSIFGKMVAATQQVRYFKQFVVEKPDLTIDAVADFLDSYEQNMDKINWTLCQVVSGTSIALSLVFGIIMECRQEKMELQNEPSESKAIAEYLLSCLCAGTDEEKEKNGGLINEIKNYLNNN